jgi:hypothetical protein
MDILKDQVAACKISKESNPYARGESIEYVELDPDERTKRLRAIIRALADIGNNRGPASGALHDGSLRPKAFIAANMKCADSPFDYVWTSRSDDAIPDLDINLLRASLKDWEDLFAARRIYVGLPVDAGRGSLAATAAAAGDTSAVTTQSPAFEIKKVIEDQLREIGFDAIVDTPRKALLRLAEEATL